MNLLRMIQVLFTVIFKATVIALLVLNYNNKAYYAIPIGLIIGLLSEAENIHKM